LTQQSPPPEYANKLGKDGKLTQEECEQHKTNNLCLFWQSGHSVTSCLNSSSNTSKTKAKASTLALNSDTPSSLKN
jgi:hypothetical protein